MRMNSTSRGRTSARQVDRLTHRFPHLNAGGAPRTGAAGGTLTRALHAVRLWFRRRRDGVVTIYVHSGRA